MDHQSVSRPRSRPQWAASYDTALCLIPPQHLWGPVDRLRALHDKAYGKWPPHVNLMYPFVRPEVLSEAVEVLSNLRLNDLFGNQEVALQEVDSFKHKRHNTIVTLPEKVGRDDDSSDSLRQVSARLQSEFGRNTEVPGGLAHMTIGQTDDAESDSHKFLLEKARLLLPLRWKMSRVALLIRDKAFDESPGSGRMRLWGSLDLSSGDFVHAPATPELYPQARLAEVIHAETHSPPKAFLQPSYELDDSDSRWKAVESNRIYPPIANAERLVVASYNVLAEFTWPPRNVRHSALISNLLSPRSVADILVLEEVTDQFLSVLLADKDIQARYPYATHGPTDDPTIGPLPSLLNVVVLSRFPMVWESMPCQRKHKTAAVVTFPSLTLEAPDGEALPLILAACHLSQGLVDGAVAAKKNEVQRLLSYLSSSFPKNPWIMAGDFNIATSSYTIEMALRKRDLSQQSLQYLRDIDDMVASAGLRDAWLNTRVAFGESSEAMGSSKALETAYEGEQGATFDPLVNTLAAGLVGHGLNNRPQRYDRILVGDRMRYETAGFNLFGQEANCKTTAGDACHASDHWGVRCLLLEQPRSVDQGRSAKNPVVSLRKAPESLGGLDGLKSCLIKHHFFPTPEDQADRAKAFETLKAVIIPTSEEDSRTPASAVMVQVGSSGLGVWTSASDIDCLCIGSISSRTFFALTIQRLKRATARGVKLLRRVSASSGTMLELSVSGIKFDLQYCPAAAVLETYPDVMKRPSSDPVFDLPAQTLTKLKSARDVFYLRRSIPDMAQYRVAHLLIKAWAKTRGLYSSRFGLLGGIHISSLLVPICKSLMREFATVSTADVVTTFFSHYSTFDFGSDLVYDPFFHRNIRYHRTFREPLCLLGWHAPPLNTAQNASVPTVRTLRAELSRAHAMLWRRGMTWEHFLGVADRDISKNVTDFLGAYKSYIKIEAQYWGASQTRGSRFVGWLESRCVQVLVDVDKQIPNLHARIWPQRFASRSPTLEQEAHDSEEYRGCYLIGLEWRGGPEETEPRENIKTAEAKLHKVLAEFESRLREDEKYYDATTSWLGTSVVRPADLRDMQIDEATWGDGTHDDDWDDELGASDAEDDEGDEEDEGDDDHVNPALTQQRIKARVHKDLVSPVLANRFRTAVEVINRIRWDSSFDRNNFIVGYEDRFTGAREKPLDLWKSDLTDEEFIPQHRILYFKRKSDGCIVWERRTRIDLVFGSGVGGEASTRQGPTMEA